MIYINPGDNFSSPKDFFNFKKELYFSARVDQEKRFFKTDGTTDGTIELAITETSDGSAYAAAGDILVFQGKVGELWSTDGTAAGTQLIKELAGSVYNMTTFKGKAIFTGSSQGTGLELWISDGTVSGTQLLKDINEGIGSSRPWDLLNIEDEYIVFSADEPFETIWLSDGTEDGTVKATDFEWADLRDPKSFVLYRGKLFFSARTNTFGTEAYYFDLLTPEKASGLVYHDVNENGQQDTDEIGLNNISLLADNGDQFITYTDEQGHFEWYIDEGTYDVTPLPDQCWEVSSTPVSYELNIEEELIQGINFGLKKTSDKTSVWAQLTSAPTRCGFEVPFWLTVANDGCDTISGTIEITLDDLVTFVGSDIVPSNVIGNTYQWDFTDLLVGDVRKIRLNLQMPDEQSIGEQVALPVSTYLLQANNTLELASENEFTSIINCAYDPNDKQVLPDRSDLSVENYTLFNERLTYTIRFQNTGTDTAFTVKIRDTLSPLLDLETFQPITASHAFRTTVYPDRVVEFLFENILLPDSIVNEKESHGFVVFQISPIEGLNEFSEIENTARIYFDFNSAIVTNTVTNTFVSSFDMDEDGFDLWEDCDDMNALINPDAEEIANNQVDEDCDGEYLTSTHTLEFGTIRMYPNPTVDFINIELEQQRSLSLKITDLQGRILHDQSFQRSINLDLKKYASGVYFIEITDPSSGAKVIERVVKMD